jgi:hypothetical protein
VTISDDLFNAAAYIDGHGWVQGTYGRPRHGPVCAMGAIANVTPFDSWGPAVHALHDYLGRDRVLNVPTWNDGLDPERGQEIVTEAMRRCAKELAAS